MHTRVWQANRPWRHSALCGFLLIGVLTLLALGSAPPASAALTPGLTFGGGGSGNGQFQLAQGAAVDPTTGDVWVVDYGTGEADGRLEKFSPSGQYLLSANTGPAGGSYGPVGVAVNASGDVFVADSQQGRVLEFDSGGTFIQSISDGNLTFAQYVAVDPSNPNNVYVSQGSAGNDVVEYTVSGSSSSYVRTIGSSGAGALNNAQGLAINTAGDLYVVDNGDALVKEYATSGTYIQSFGGSGSGDGQFSGPTALAIDPLTDNVVVSDTNNVLQTFDSSGAFISSLQPTGDASATISGVAVDPSSGDEYVVDATDNVVTKLTGTTGEVEQQLSNSGLVFFRTASALASDPTSGDLYIDYGDKVEKRDASGNLIRSIIVVGDGTPLVAGVAVDASGNLFVSLQSDGNGRAAQVQEFDASGAFVKSFGIGKLQTPHQLAVDPANGEVFVADSGAPGSGTGTIYAFDPVTGQVASSFAVTPAPGKPDSVSANGIAFNAGGTRLYVGDSVGDQLFGYTPSGTRLFEVGGFGSGAGQFANVFDVAVDPSSGSVFVVDGGNQRIERFDANGLYLAQFSVGEGAEGVAVGLDPAASNYGDLYAVYYHSNLSHLIRFGTPAPAATSNPSITGTAQDGQTLNADTGSWSSPDTLTYAYQWQDCPSGGGSCTNVASGGTSSSYTAAASDVGSFLRVEVTATDQRGQAGVASFEMTAVVAKPAAPVNTGPPPISGTARDGQTLTAGHGSWTSPDTLTYAYQWQDCPSDGGSCANVATGGTSASYRAAASDVGSFLQVAVTATDQEGQTGMAWKKTAAVVAKPAAPTIRVAPSISGTAQDGQNLAASPGSWTSPDTLTYAYQWQDCPSGGGACANVTSGGTSWSYRAVASDVGSFLQVVVTATDQEGQTGTATKKTASVVAKPAAPTVKVAPTITGTARDGQTLTAGHGSWTSPDTLAYAYQWQDCPSAGGACANVASGGTSSSYTAAASDVGSFLQIVVTATDQEGQPGTGSKKTTVVVAKPPVPVNTAAPSISGIARDGQTLTAGHGSWASPDTLTYSYQWQHCPSGGGACANVASGGTLASYRAAASDVGSFLQVVVTATDQEGQARTATKRTAAVVAKPAAPTSKVAPSISGTAQDGQNLAASPGSWTSPDTLTYAYQWQDCPSGGGACANVTSGGTSWSYRAVASDVGSFLQVVVTATDQEGQTATATHKTAAVVAKPAAPVSAAAPTITGTARDGQTLTAGHGSWTSPDTLTYKYQWQDCPSGGGACANVASGGTSSTYTAAASDVGSFLQVVVTATDQESQTGTGSKKTTVVVAKPAAPANTTLPSITGTAKPGQTLTGNHGSWTSPDTLTYTQVWRRCTSTGTGCQIISGANALTYVVQAADANHKLQLMVTATDQEAQSTSASALTPVVSSS